MDPDSPVPRGSRPPPRRASRCLPDVRPATPATPPSPKRSDPATRLRRPSKAALFGPYMGCSPRLPPPLRRHGSLHGTATSSPVPAFPGISALPGDPRPCHPWLKEVERMPRWEGFAKCQGCGYDLATGEGVRSCSWGDCPSLPEELNVFCPDCRFNFYTMEGNPPCEDQLACSHSAEPLAHVANMLHWQAQHLAER